MVNQIVTSPRPLQESKIADRFLEPFARMRSSMDHLFDDFPARWPAFHFNGSPAVEMTESDESYVVAAEIPGIKPEDVDLQIDRDMLILKGEKKEEREESKQDYVISERSYGSFERRIAIPADGMTDKIEAQTSNGVLRITIPRSHEADSQRRHIQIKTETPKQA